MIELDETPVGAFDIGILGRRIARCVSAKSNLTALGRVLRTKGAHKATRSAFMLPRSQLLGVSHCLRRSSHFVPQRWPNRRTLQKHKRLALRNKEQAGAVKAEYRLAFTWLDGYRL